MTTQDAPHVAILGAGLAGLSIAWRLAQRGARVDLIDKWHAGHAASWAAAGMLAPGAEFSQGDDPLLNLGRAGRNAWPFFAAELEDESKGTVGLVPSGSLVLAWTDEDAKRLEGHCKRQAIPEWLSPRGARELEPAISEEIKGAAFIPGDAHVNNRWLVERLVTACMLRGVRLHEGIEDAGLAFAGETLIGIKSESLSLAADVVVIAAGAWSSIVNGVPYAARVPVRPVKGQMIAVAEGAMPLHHLVWSGETYLVPRAGLPLAVGATVEEAGFDISSTDVAKAELFAGAKRAAPQAIGEQVIDAWAGLRPAAPDGQPILGRSVVSNLIYATGQFRNGILFAPIVANAIADLILSGTETALIAPFSPLRFSDPKST